MIHRTVHLMPVLLIALIMGVYAMPSHAEELKKAPKRAAVKVFTQGQYAPDSIFSMTPQSGKEAILLSFYRNSGRKPDFERWSKMTPLVINAPDYDKPVVALNEQVRLQTAYENTDPDEFLVIHTALDGNNYSAAQDVIFFEEFRTGGTLRQNIYGEKLAIVVQDIDKFQAIYMDNDNASYFFQVLNIGQGGNDLNENLVAEMVVRPKSAIFSKAARVGKNDHYLFITELAQLTLWRAENGMNDRNTFPLWSWRAPWYEIEDDNADLLQLYKAIN